MIQNWVDVVFEHLCGETHADYLKSENFYHALCNYSIEKVFHIVLL